MSAGRGLAVFLMGPTGAGKSDLALGLAREFPFEIISVDSAMVYRGMDIGTAKPDAAARLEVPHHLIDVRDPVAVYSAGDFVADALPLMEDIRRRGRYPLLVGGTMLYFHVLRSGIAALPEADFAVRADIDHRAAAVGWPAMHRELARVDPAAAAKIHENDSQRIQRALEVYRLTGEPISRLQARRVPMPEAWQVTELALAPPERTALNLRIAARFAGMLDLGFVAEVAALRERSDLSAEHPAMRAVGYRQLWKYLAGDCALDEATVQGIAATRQLAKRQMTWLRTHEKAIWFDPMHPNAASRIRDALCECGFTPWS